MKRVILLVLATLVLTGCGATIQPPVTLTTNVFTQETQPKIGIAYVGPEDKATTHIYGAACLLCYGVASSLTSSLDNHLESSINQDELNKLKVLVMEKYQENAQSVNLVKLPTAIKNMADFNDQVGYANKDFRPLKSRLGIDILVVLQIPEHGAFRSFSNYIPNGDPQGFVNGLLYAVDLSNNAYVQYLDITEKVQPAGEWDEAPAFPNVTTSYYQAVENVRQKIDSALTAKQSVQDTATVQTATDAAADSSK